MNAIIGMTNLALEIAREPEQRSYLSDVQRSAASLLGILNDILDFSKIELELVREPFRAREEIERVLETLRPAAAHKALELRFEPSPGLPEVLNGDPGRLRQVLINLAGNAIKFTAAGEVVVRAGLESNSPQGVWCHFVVADTGIGIAPEKQAAIFGAFEQADASMTRRYGGTGLGLAISRRLVELMNGRIWVVSPWRDPSGRVRGGSAFHSTALFAPAEEPAEAPIEVAEGSPAAPETEADDRPLHILLAEDNDINRKLACRLLEKQGHRVSIATNGREAVSMLEQTSVDVVLMDVQMPEMDGIQATAEVRRRERRSGRRTPIIAMTAHAMSGDRDRCLAAGMDGYIAKPVQARKLFQEIRRVTSPGGRAGCLPPARAAP